MTNQTTIDTKGWKVEGEMLMLSPILTEEISKGGIYIPSTAYRKTQRGIVIQKGPTASQGIPLGAEVFFPQNTEWELVIDEDTKQTIYLVKESDVLMWRVNTTSQE